MAKEDLKLLSGHELTLQCLEQRRVYGAMLEGLPTQEKNQRLLEALREQAGGCFSEWSPI